MSTMAESAAPTSTFTRRWKMNRRMPMRGVHNFLLRRIIATAIKFTINGIENVPKTGAAVIMINHIAFLDPVLVMPSLGRGMTPMTKVEGYENPWLRFFISPYGAIPVHRGAIDREAIRTATEILDSGEMLLISPEGTRSHTGGLQKGQDGMAYIVSRAQAPVHIVPIALTGSDGVFPALKRFNRGAATMTIGAPFVLPRGEGKPNLAAMTDFAMHQLAAILPAEMRGVYR